MAQLNQAFDPAQVADDDRDFAPMPDCEPVAQIIESELTTKDNGAKQRLVLTWEILDGEFKGRRIWDGYNIVHPSTEAQAISERQLKKVCTAVGFQGALTNSEALHFKPCRIKVRTEKKREGYDQRNEIKGFAPVGSAPAAAPATAGGAARPWAS